MKEIQQKLLESNDEKSSETLKDKIQTIEKQIKELEDKSKDLQSQESKLEKKLEKLSVSNKEINNVTV